MNYLIYVLSVTKTWLTTERSWTAEKGQTPVERRQEQGR